MSRIDEIKARLAAATPGPWSKDEENRIFGGPELSEAEMFEASKKLECSSHNFEITSERPLPDDDTLWRWRRMIVETDSGYYPPRDSDADLIANAPADIEFLLAELERTLDNHNRMAAHLEEMEETIKTAHTERDKAIAAARVATLKEMP